MKFGGQPRLVATSLPVAGTICITPSGAGAGGGKTLEQALLANYAKYEQGVQVVGPGICQDVILKIQPKTNVVEVRRGAEGGGIAHARQV